MLDRHCTRNEINKDKRAARLRWALQAENSAMMCASCTASCWSKLKSGKVWTLQVEGSAVRRELQGKLQVKAEVKQGVISEVVKALSE